MLSKPSLSAMIRVASEIITEARKDHASQIIALENTLMRASYEFREQHQDRTDLNDDRKAWEEKLIANILDTFRQLPTGGLLQSRMRPMKDVLKILDFENNISPRDIGRPEARVNPFYNTPYAEIAVPPIIVTAPLPEDPRAAYIMHALPEPPRGNEARREAVI